MMERLLGALLLEHAPMDVKHVEAILHRTKVMEGASLDAEVMDSVRGTVEKENMW